MEVEAVGAMRAPGGGGTGNSRVTCDTAVPQHDLTCQTRRRRVLLARKGVALLATCSHAATRIICCVENLTCSLSDALIWLHGNPARGAEQ